MDSLSSPDFIPIQPFSHSPILRTLAWSPDGTKVATDGEYIDSILIWNLASKQMPKILVANNFPEEPYHLITELEWSRDGRSLLSGGSDETQNGSSLPAIHLWDAETGNLLKTFDGSGAIEWGVQDEQFAASNYYERGFAIWSIETGNVIASFDEQTEGWMDLAWNIDESLILSVHRDGSVKIWDVHDIAEAKSYTITNLSITDFIGNVAWRPSSNQFAIAGDSGVIVGEFDAKDSM